MRAAVADTRLDAIAGSPAVFRDSVGTTVYAAGGPFEDFTLVVSIQCGTDLSANYPILARFGGSSGQATIQLTAAASSTIAFRFDAPGGSVNLVGYRAGRIPNTRTIACLRSSAGMTTLSMWTSSNTSAGAIAANPGTGIIDRSLTVYAPTNVGDRALAAWYYPRTLSDDEVVRVLGWAARKFSLSLSLSRSRLRGRTAWVRAA